MHLDLNINMTTILSIIITSAIQGATMVFVVRYTTKGAEHLEKIGNGKSIWRRLWNWVFLREDIGHDKPQP